MNFETPNFSLALLRGLTTQLNVSFAVKTTISYSIMIIFLVAISPAVSSW